jgi:hypothetical protein
MSFTIADTAAGLMFSGWLHNFSAWLPDYLRPQANPSSAAHHTTPEPMAPSIQSLQEVLAGTDEATATLMLQLAIEDVQSDDTTFPYENDFLCAKAEWERELKRFRDTRPKNALLVQPPLPPAVAFQCAGCEERFGSDDCLDVPCGHHYCDGCLNGLFRVAMTDAQAYPPRCCRQTIPLEDVQRYLNKELATQFAAKKPELDDPKPTYCNVPTCSTYIGEAQKEANVACCPSCKAKTCLLCKQADHEGDCAGDEATEATKQLAKSQGWQRCPQCKGIVELMFGCNHMT